jgi:CheY-like chemotaxis protein
MTKTFLILVVEDEDLHRKMMVKILGALGHTVLEAEDGFTAVNLATQRRPDLILMDINLPGMDGLTATRRLKENSATAWIPVIALTALAMTGDHEKILEAGCDDYIIKPLLIKPFVAKLEDWLDNIRRTRASEQADDDRGGLC